MRILPAWWLALAATVVVRMVVEHKAFGLLELLANASLVYTLVPGLFLGILFVGWTLCIELQFYVLVPIAARLLRRFLTGPVSSGWLAAGVLAVWVASGSYALLVTHLLHNTTGPFPAIARFALPGMLCMFCPGILIALALQRRANNPASDLIAAVAHHPFVSIAFAAACAGSGWWLQQRSATVADLRYEVFAVGAGAVLLVVLTSSHWASPPARLLGSLGLASYGIYLWHVPVQILYGWGGYGPPLHFERTPSWAHVLAWPAAFIAVGVFVIPIATASWLAVERPLIRLAASVSRLMIARRSFGTSPGLR